MLYFREMSFVRALLVALVVLFVVGAGVPEGALARVEMQNGHEGDPTDGHDVVSGGSGDPGDANDQQRDEGSIWCQQPINGMVAIDWVIQNDGSILPVFCFSNFENQLLADLE